MATQRICVMLKDQVRDVAAERVAAEARRYLGIVTGRTRVGKIYTVACDLSESQLAGLADLGLRDAILQDAFPGWNGRAPGYASYVVVAKLPGVTDDEGVSAQKTLNDLLGLDLPVAVQRIFSADLYLFEEDISRAALEGLATRLLGNPLVNRFEFGALPVRSDYLPGSPAGCTAVAEVIDLAVSDRELERISKDRLLGLNLEELRAIQAHFAQPGVSAERRRRGLPVAPTDCELEILGQTWSEHCKHKEFNALIEFRDLDTGDVETIDSLFKTYIRGSTDVIRERLEAAGDHWLVKVFSDNAGVVRIDAGRLFVFKVETHNSPSALDPYGGAITGILGNNRDPLGTGAGGARLLFNTDVLCFGRPDYAGELLPGQLHPLRVFEGVRRGIEDGGNKSGVPTVNGALLFDDRFAGKPLVFCGTGAILPARVAGRDSWVKEIAAGDRIVMAGGRVGKDGIHGATFSSAEIDEHSPLSAVQIGSPITQKLLSDFLESAAGRGLIKCITDNGAGGLSSSVGELASLSGGAVVELDRVPLKYAGLRPWEIFLSESQERMTLVVRPGALAALGELARLHEVELSDLGEFTADGFLEVRFDGTPVARLALDFLHDGVPRKRMSAEWGRLDLAEPALAPITDHGQVLLRLLHAPNICSRERVIRQYDHEVKGRSVLKPLMGRSGRAPQDAAVLRLDLDSWAGIAVSNGIAPAYGDIDPYEMSAGAFDEAVRQIIAVGGRLPRPGEHANGFWSVCDNFCMPDSEHDPLGNPDGRLKLGKLVRMCQALHDMALFFNIPMTSGKDSMKNDFRSGPVKISAPPTLLYSMVAKIDDVRRVVSADFKAAGDGVYLVGETYDELGGSEFYRLFDELGANVPRVRREAAAELYGAMAAASSAGLFQSCHDLSQGGLGVGLAESLFGRPELGLDLELPRDMDLTTRLFSESHSRFVVSVRPRDRAAVESALRGRATRLGEITDRGRMVVRYDGADAIDLGTDELLDAWTSGLEF